MRRHPSFPAVANVGFELGTQLRSVGIDSYERLCDVGAKEAWLRLRVQFPERNDARTLLALQGAIDDRPIDLLPPHVAGQLRTWRRRHIEGEEAGFSEE